MSPSETATSDIDLLDKEKEAVDPELLELPDPPRRERRSTLLLMAVAAIASAAMAVSLTRDAAYVLQPASATDLGELSKTQTASLASNTFVEGHGQLGGAGSIRYERPLESDSYRIASVSGRENIWVEIRVPNGAESNRFIPKSDFSGRLVKFSDVGLRHRGLRSAIEDRTGEKVSKDAFLIVDGQSPADARAFALLWAMFIGFAMWNIVTIARLVRKVK